MEELNDKELQRLWWGDPVEENQWAVLQSLRNWNTDADFDGQPPENALIYVREGPPPAAVKIYEGGVGERNDFLEGAFNDMADKPFDRNPGMQPFLFSKITKRGNYARWGKLDDESKAMLRERYGVDVDG